ncbi:methyl-accepting chemotaxis protein, partial [Rhizobium leguminosarum]
VRLARSSEAELAVSERHRLEQDADERRTLAEQTDKDVGQLGDALQALADGDLTQQIGTPFIPSLEKRRADFNSAVEKLRAARQKVAQNASAIAG